MKPELHRCGDARIEGDSDQHHPQPWTLLGTVGISDAIIRALG
jgi:hypothetical protein